MAISSHQDGVVSCAGEGPESCAVSTLVSGEFVGLVHRHVMLTVTFSGRGHRDSEATERASAWRFMSVPSSFKCRFNTWTRSKRLPQIAQINGCNREACCGGRANYRDARVEFKFRKDGS